MSELRIMSGRNIVAAISGSTLDDVIAEARSHHDATVTDESGKILWHHDGWRIGGDFEPPHQRCFAHARAGNGSLWRWRNMMAIWLIGIVALHAVVMFALTTELVIERRRNAALSERNAAQAQALARSRKWNEMFLSGLPEADPLEINRIKPFGLGPEHFEGSN